MPRDPRVDAYIGRSAAFAQPVLAYLRDVVHETCPDVQETMKWSTPHFEHHGMLCAIAAFKSHCALRFWKASLIPGLSEHAANDGSAGDVGRITSIDDLPSRPELVRLIREAMRLNEESVPVRRTAKVPRTALPLPPQLAAALDGNAAARATFDALSPSQRREYIEWVAGARRDATREARVAQSVVWLAEGKPYNWKYKR